MMHEKRSRMSDDCRQRLGAAVIIVEDDPDIRNVNGQRLQALGYRTMTASSGDAAVKMLAEHGPVDLVFTDVMMPGTVSGVDLARHVLAAYPTARVLLTSGYADVTAEVEELTSRKVGFLAKPYRLAALARAVREALE